MVSPQNNAQVSFHPWSPKVGPVAAVAPAAAHAAPAPARPSAAEMAGRMTAAPQSIPLTAIPTEWIPNGSSERRVETKSGFLTFDKGHVRVTRTASSIDVAKMDNPSLGGITLKSDPKDPLSVTAVTPRGTFTGRLSGSGNSGYDFQANDHRHSIHISRERNGLRFDTTGFGKLDHGHLNVYDR